MEEQTHKHINENADSLEIGTAGKGGVIKVYGNFLDPVTFKEKIDQAVAQRKYLQSLVQEEKI
jgi:hypothetical protein